MLCTLQGAGLWKAGYTANLCVQNGCSPARPGHGGQGRAGTDLGPRDLCTEQYNDLDACEQPLLCSRPTARALEFRARPGQQRGPELASPVSWVIQDQKEGLQLQLMLMRCCARTLNPGHLTASEHPILDVPALRTMPVSTRFQSLGWAGSPNKPQQVLC